MQSFITILFILAIIAIPLQMTLINKQYMVYTWLFIVGIFIYMMHFRAIEQSYAQFREQVADSSIIGNFMVLQIIEATGGILLSIFLIRLHYNGPVKKIFRYFKYIPGIVVFPALFYLESYLFLKVPGIDFQRLAILMAVIVPSFLFIIKYLFKHLISEFDLRVEIKFLLHIFQLLIAIIISIGLFRLPVHTKNKEFPLNQLIIMLAFTILIVLVGIFIYSIKFKKIKKVLHG